MTDQPQAAEIAAIFMDCWSIEEGSVKVESITQDMYFDPGKLRLYKEVILKSLHQLPLEFMAADCEPGGGDGWSFLNASYDRNGELWTSFQKVVEQLVALGIAIGAVRYLLPKEVWTAFPGSVPYFVVVNPPEEDHALL